MSEPQSFRVDDIVLTKFGDVGAIYSILRGGLGQENFVEIRYFAHQRYPEGSIGKYPMDLITVIAKGVRKDIGRP